MKPFYETRLKVRYAETDQMGVAYHANYFVWFEVGRVEMLRELGVAYRQMEAEDDTHIVVVEARCQYKRAARYDDELWIRTRVAEARTRTFRFSYEVLRGATGELLATGETAHVVCDREGRPKALPEKYRKHLLLAPNAAPAGEA